jgi:hypothetical protein
LIWFDLLEGFDGFDGLEGFEEFEGFDLFEGFEGFDLFEELEGFDLFFVPLTNAESSDPRNPYYKGNLRLKGLICLRGWRG